ncbi:MAG TPA: hypothetical protein VGS19_01590 [Streptosporangiaceae bacterium]|nr:hypothetical protein [Streptosporangiaceae bacterium]
MPHPCIRVPIRAVALGAPVMLAALLTSVAAPASGAAPAGDTAPAPGYQVLVTSAPGGLHPVTASVAGLAPATQAVTLQLGGKKIVVPLATAGDGDGPFAVTALTHDGQHGQVAARDYGPLHTLTVAGTNLAGQPDTGDGVLVGDIANSNTPGTGFSVFKNGAATFSVPTGTYWAAAAFAQFSGHTLSSLRLDVLPQFRVTRDTTVGATAAAATSKVTVATPRPATTQSLTLTIVRAAPHAPVSAFSPKVDSLEESVDNASLWINRVSRRPSYGTLRVFTSAQLTSPPGQAVPYAYTLDFANPPGTIPAQHFAAAPAGLATVSDDFVQDMRSVGAWQTFVGTHYQVGTSFVGALDLPLPLPAHQVEYSSASPAMLWQTYYLEYRTITAGQTPGGQTGAARLLHAGQRLAQTWGAYPLHPGANVSLPHTGLVLVRSSAARAGNDLSLDVTPFSDNQPGHRGAGLAVPLPGQVNDVSGSYALYQDGTKIASGNAVTATGSYGDVQVSAALAAKPSLIKFVLSASRARVLKRATTVRAPYTSGFRRTVWGQGWGGASGGRLPLPV